MSNIWGNISLALKLKLGIVPSTETYEAKLKSIWQDVEFVRNFAKEGLLKEYEELKREHKGSKSEQESVQNRIKEITQSESWKRYHRLKKSSTISNFLKFEETFFDDFEDKSLNEEKWLTKFFWGEAILGRGYSHSEEFQNYTEGANLHLKKSSLTIRTTEENSTSLSWNKQYGFLSRKSNYTSGIINTGKSFRQQYGRFEAKLSVKPTDGVYNAFWMVGSSATPHLNIFKVTQNLEIGLINDEKENNQSQVSVSYLKEQSYIAGIEWSPKEIKWLLNGVVVKKVSKNLPSTPLYLGFSSGVYKDLKNNLSNEFTVDWVRCFKN